MSITDDKEQLILLCTSSALFPHKSEVLALINGNGVVERGDGAGIPVRSMLGIYNRRLNRGRKAYRNAEHPNRLLNDIETYISELAKAPEDHVQSWNVSEEYPAYSYLLFEGIDSKRILGCLFVADKRMVTPKQWKDLWGISDRT